MFARLADAYSKAGQPDRALEVLDKGLARHPSYVSAHLVRARILRRLDRLDEAVASFKKALDIDADNIIALRALADMALARGDLLGARDSYARLAELQPLDEEVRAMRARLEAEALEASAPAARGTASRDASSSGEADESASAPLEVGEGNLMTATMADLFVQQGLYDRAIRIYERLLRFRPDDFSLLERLEEIRSRQAGGSGAAGPRTVGEEAAERGRTAGVAEASEDTEVAQAPEVAGDAGAAGERSLTIRQYLRALQEGRAPVPERRSGLGRTSRFAAWLSGKAGR